MSGPGGNGSNGVLTGIRAVTLDVGGTLIEPFPSVGHVYAEVAARHGVTGADPETLNLRFRAAWRANPEFRHTRAEWAALVDKSFEGYCDPPPSCTFFDELYYHFTRAAAWHIYEDVLPTLRGLAARGIALAALSNWDDRLHPLLQNLGLRDHFKSVIVSCDVGVPKPHRLMFQRAAESLNVPPSEILHIGDEPEADVGGAREAGLRALLLVRRTSKELVPGAIRSLQEIL